MMETVISQVLVWADEVQRFELSAGHHLAVDHISTVATEVSLSYPEKRKKFQEGGGVSGGFPG